ncbi:hypothetical protein J19TS1_52930 [Heyndrickxia oleronia]|nr:hypothetical protein J19TS1_52930 [Heyndrickxia oleronia]
MYVNLVSLQLPKIESQKEVPVGFVTPYKWLFGVRYVSIVRAKQAMKSFLEIKNYESFMTRNVMKENLLK